MGFRILNTAARRGRFCRDKGAPGPCQRRAGEEAFGPLAPNGQTPHHGGSYIRFTIGRKKLPVQLRSPVFQALALCGGLAMLVMVYVYVALELRWFDPAKPFDDPVLQSLNSDGVVVWLNGSPIVRSQVFAHAVSSGVVIDEADLDLRAKEIKEVTEAVIDQRLLANEARRQGLHLEPTSQPSLILAEDRALSEVLLRRLIENQVTDQSLRRVYDDQVKLMEPTEQVRARHILVETRAAADLLSAQLETGADFAELAKEHSIDPSSGPKGGDLDYFTRLDMVPEFSEVAFATPVGQISQPFKSQFGWHIVKVEDKRMSKPPGFDELRTQILRYRTYEVVQSEIDRLREGASIDYVLGEPIRD